MLSGSSPHVAMASSKNWSALCRRALTAKGDSGSANVSHRVDRPPLVVAVYAGNRVLDERLGNPVSVQLTAGTEVIAFVAMVSGSPTTQSFIDGSTMTGEDVWVELSLRGAMDAEAPRRS
jgi:hypothetical protein